MLTKIQKKYLKSMAHSVKSTVQVGKYGVSEGTIQSLDEALLANELVKVSILQNNSEQREQVANLLVKYADCELVQVIGRQIVLYRQNVKNPKINLPKE